MVYLSQKDAKTLLSYVKVHGPRCYVSLWIWLFNWVHIWWQRLPKHERFYWTSTFQSGCTPWACRCPMTCTWQLRPMYSTWQAKHKIEGFFSLFHVYPVTKFFLSISCLNCQVMLVRFWGVSRRRLRCESNQVVVDSGHVQGSTKKLH